MGSQVMQVLSEQKILDELANQMVIGRHYKKKGGGFSVILDDIRFGCYFFKDIAGSITLRGLEDYIIIPSNENLCGTN
jgi:hypothetical protein